MAKPMDQITWQEIETGSVVTEPGNAREYLTGDWRSRRPVVDREKCTRCGICWLYCPDAAVKQVEESYFQADLNYCKGCGICAEECPPDAISMVEEEK